MPNPPNYHDDSRPKRNGGGSRKASNPFGASASSNHDIPFRDADHDSGETPIDELDNFIVFGRDDRGGTEHIHLNIIPFLRRQIRIILQANRFPYLSEADFIRHAIVRHIYWLVSIRGSIPKHIVAALNSISEACRDDEMRIQVERTLKQIDTRVSFHMGRGDHMEAIRLLNLIKTKMTGVQPSVWQRQFWDEFNKRWSGYLNPPQQSRAHH